MTSFSGERFAIKSVMSFDEYCQSVREADVNFVLTARECAPWYLEHIPVEELVAQFGSDGGASVADGIVRHDAIILIWPHHPYSCRIWLNGQLMRFEDIAILPPSSHFIFSADGPRTWISISVPLKTIMSTSQYASASEWSNLQPGLLLSVLELKTQLTDLAEMMRQGHRLLLQGGGSNPIEDRLHRLASEALVRWRSTNQSRHKNERANAVVQVSKALQFLQSEQLGDQWHVSDLASAAEVSERSLLRAFNAMVGMGPVRYLHLRQLNLIRRELRQGVDRAGQVTEAMTGAGVSQLGRAAGEYKALFGELPSETLKKCSEARPRL